MSKILKTVFFGIILLCAPSAFATTFRIDPTPVQTVAGNVAIGGFPAIYAVPNATIKLCTDSTCATNATAYTDVTGGTPCPGGAPVTLPGTNVCVSAAGGQGQFGFWLNSGTYYYEVTTPNGQTFGPFPLSAPAGGSSISGSGTTNTVPKWTGSSAVGNSSITDNGTTVTIPEPLTLNGQTYTFPSSQTTSDCLSTNGAGTLSWVSCGGGGSGYGLDCTTFSGANAGAKIAACMAALPSTGGVANAIGFTGSQNVSQNIWSGIAKPVQLILGPATFTDNFGQTIQCTGCSMVGTGPSNTTGGGTGGPVWNYTGGNSNPAGIVVNADDITIQGFELTCNDSNDTGILDEYPIGTLITRMITRSCITHIKFGNSMTLNAFSNWMSYNDISVGNGETGVVVSRGGDAITILSNSIRGAAGNTNARCMYISGAANTHIIGNIIEQCGGNDINIDNVVGTTDGTQIDGNYMETHSTGDFAISLASGVLGTHISNNYLQGMTGPSAYVIDIKNGALQTSITNNRFLGFSTAAIHNEVSSPTNTTALITVTGNGTLGTLIDSLNGTIQVCPTGNGCVYNNAFLGVGETPLWPLDVTFDNANDAVAKFRNTDVLGYGVSITPGVDDTSHYSLNLTNAARSANVHQFFGNGNFNLGNGGSFAHMDNLTSNVITDSGAFVATQYGTLTHCMSVATPASCGGNSAGAITVAAGGTIQTVDTNLVSAQSQIFVQEDPGLATLLGITCNAVTGRTYTITARTAGVSFQITSSAMVSGTAACLSYFIVN